MSKNEKIRNSYFHACPSTDEYIYRLAKKWAYPPTTPFIFNTIAVMVECLIWAHT
jgi:hypothetical protein